MANLLKTGSNKTPLVRARELDRGPITEHLGFRLANDPYAAPVSLIREILKPPAVTPVPRAHHEILGIMSVRGQLITVIDLRRRLRLTEEPPSRHSRILLVDSGKETLGLYVDEVLQVYRLSESEIEPAAPALGGDVSEYITGIARPSPHAALWRQTRASLERAAEAMDRRSKADKPKGVQSGAGEENDSPAVVILLDLLAILS